MFSGKEGTDDTAILIKAHLIKLVLHCLSA